MEEIRRLFLRRLVSRREVGWTAARWNGRAVAAGRDGKGGLVQYSVVES